MRTPLPTLGSDCGQPLDLYVTNGMSRDFAAHCGHNNAERNNVQSTYAEQHTSNNTMYAQYRGILRYPDIQIDRESGDTINLYGGT
ncbi:hypothetical protein KQX54_020639 [Cotesia glomerata]|uniref:Uncharacterized protein n=1 Tax=Cotesia glomerata TaxID=32391 RepID=A0AAV7I4T4_COTGL|nr:hypothetical protein KQX54_020639 [Cotesia glomerata]